MPRRTRKARPADLRTDAELVRAAQDGDASALAALVTRHAGAVHGVGSRFCKNAEAAAEVRQQTLLAAVRALPEFRGDAAVGTWLFAIARRACARLRRGRRRAAAALSSDLDQAELYRVPDPSPLPDDVVAEHEIALMLQQAVTELPAPHREVFLLRDAAGLTAPEVAERLGIGVDAVKSRLHRARAAVREAIVERARPQLLRPTTTASLPSRNR
jgi:RNA polymerase sigma-70 factor (ECF subfamily)